MSRLFDSFFSKANVACCGIVIATASGFVGCEWDDDDDAMNHHPPPGLGSLIIDNNTANDLTVFIDGAQTNDTDSAKANWYDLTSGVRRVVLDEQNGDRSFSGDVDILQDRRTILDVSADPNDHSAFDVFINYD